MHIMTLCKNKVVRGWLQLGGGGVMTDVKNEKKFDLKNRNEARVFGEKNESEAGKNNLMYSTEVKASKTLPGRALYI